jgi:chromosome segregation ATPase
MSKLDKLNAEIQTLKHDLKESGQGREILRSTIRGFEFDLELAEESKVYLSTKMDEAERRYVEMRTERNEAVRTIANRDERIKKLCEMLKLKQEN